MIHRRFSGERKDRRLSMLRIRKVSRVKKAHIIEELMHWQKNDNFFLHLSKRTRKIISASPSKKARKKAMRPIQMTPNILKKKSLPYLPKPTKMQVYNE